jgi:hypothetical protein
MQTAQNLQCSLIIHLFYTFVSLTLFWIYTNWEYSDNRPPSIQMPHKETPVPTNFHTALGLLNKLCNSAEVSDLIKRHSRRPSTSQTDIEAVLEILCKCPYRFARRTIQCHRNPPCKVKTACIHPAGMYMASAEDYRYEYRSH